MTDSDEGERPAFPAPGYARFILAPAFDFGRKELFTSMMAANMAHAVMLLEQGIIEPDVGARLLSGILQAEADGPESYVYDPEVEDLFFAVERRVIELAGPDAGGNLQLARSRNDLTPAMCRMVLRQRLLDVAEQLSLLRSSLAELVQEHIETLMPGVTHTQEAQPTTLAHYLLGVMGPLGRDDERLRHTFERVNRSPLGVAAFTTSSLPVDRDRVAKLLGFIGLVENGYDAVGAADHMLESVAALRTMCLSVVRFVNDLLTWARTDVGIVTVGEEFIQISSIMPQKHNPVVLEHIRARIGYVLGDAATVEAMVHTAAFGDTVDVEDEIYVPLVRCCDHAVSVLSLLTSVLQTIRIDRERLGGAARAGFGASTGLAESLTVDFKLPFRAAHSVVARIVRQLAGNGQDLCALTSEMVVQSVLTVTGTRIQVSDEVLRRAVDPALFVARRTIPGGPAATTVAAALERERVSQQASLSRLRTQREMLDRANAELNRIAREQSTPA